MRRFYIPPAQMGKEEFIITGSDAHHIRDVLRLKPDDEVVLFDGTGREREARIVSVARKQVVVAMGESIIDEDISSQVKITMAQGYLKDKKMDGLVRQLTELGIGRWIPFFSRRSVPLPDQKRLDGRYQRWKKISIEALKQCRRARAMIIDPVGSFSDVLEIAAPYDLKIIFWEASNEATLKTQIGQVCPESAFVMIGPEGGFEEHEISEAKNAGFIVAGLGPRILKAETAAAAAATLVQYIFGDIG